MKSIQINSKTEIPLSELTFRSSQSSGPGGQHVNKAETKVELLFDVENSLSLTSAQKNKIKKALQNRISTEGILRIAAQDTRSQVLNKQLAITRFQRLLQSALKRKKKRIPTSPSPISKEKRIEKKKKRSEIKKARTKPEID